MLLEDTFPLLFPYGRGGPGEGRKRRKHMSRLACIKRLLCVSTRQFQTKLFVAHAFDMEAQQRAVKVATLTLPPDAYSKFSKVTPEELKTAIKLLADRESARASGNLMPSIQSHLPTSGEKAAYQLLSCSIMACNAIWNTEAERLEYRKTMYAAIEMMGLPHLFVTFAPYDVAQPIIVHLVSKESRKEGDDFTKATPKELCGMCARDKRYAAVAGNPVAVYMWYKKLQDLFYTDVLGIDLNTGRCRRSGGLFGRVKMFEGCTEDQERGSLHEHVLLWLLGGAPTIQKLNHLLQTKEWKDKLIQLRDRIICTNFSIVHPPPASPSSTPSLPQQQQQQQQHQVTPPLFSPVQNAKGKS
jgi:hypothetical protein